MKNVAVTMEANVTNKDLDSGIYMQCTKCFCIGDYQDIKTLTENQISEGTTVLVSHTLDTGGGYEDLSKLVSKMNLNNHIAKRRFYKIKSEVQKTTVNTCQKYKKRQQKLSSNTMRKKVWNLVKMGC